MLEFFANGVVDGLRIDHVDGLLEPGRYLDRMRAAVDARRPNVAGEPRFPIYVEKILAASFAGAIVALVAELPVYRTYMDAEHPDATGHDRAVLVETFARVRTSAAADESVVAALEHALLDEWRDADADLARTRLSFVLRLQQLTGPAAAKGVEDTALYVCAPLTSRNEVGGDPAMPVDGAAQRLHERLRERVERYPRSLNATNTHDTKRSADVRARLDGLSEHAGERERVLRRWRRVHRDSRTLVKGRLAPSSSADDVIYQAPLGLWPLTGARLDDDAWLGELRERLSEYLQKAMPEARVSITGPIPTRSTKRRLRVSWRGCSIALRTPTGCSTSTSSRARWRRRRCGTRWDGWWCISRPPGCPTSTKAMNSGSLHSWIPTTGDP